MKPFKLYLLRLNLGLTLTLTLIPLLTTALPLPAATPTNHPTPPSYHPSTPHQQERMVIERKRDSTANYPSNMSDEDGKGMGLFGAVDYEALEGFMAANGDRGRMEFGD